MIIQLSQNLENPILAAGHSGRYASLNDAMAEAAALLVERLRLEQAEVEQPATNRAGAVAACKPIWEVAAELRKSVPPEEWAKLPVDGAAQHDHYIYGTPKHPTS
jgi:hypothetical protein